jgi:eukaryotic-like serine/threonine-protein kinase
VSPATQRGPTELPELLDERTATRDEVPQLRFGDLVSDSGSVEIHHALQLPLCRPVTVKRTRRAQDGVAAKALVDEALVAGGLEHPNIVPIHTLGRDREGRTLLVLKRIEGQAWSQLLRRPDRPAELRRHLDVLVQVCHAIELAHDRGIVHRNLKPDNVMIGPFGEVYVVDWALAVSIRNDDLGRLPHVRDIRSAQGTAAFMAPEMVAADADAIGQASDIYLLGGILHVVLTGTAPFEGTTTEDRRADLEAAVTFPQMGLPSELAALCEQVLQPQPSARGGSVTAMREALERAAGHLTSLKLSGAANERLRTLEDVAASAVPAGRMQQMLTEARFGFQQALDTWSANLEASQGLEHTFERACEHAVQQDNLAGASAYLASLASPSEALIASVRRLELTLAERGARRAELEEFELDEDIGVDAQPRWRAVLGLGVLAAAGLALGVATSSMGYRFAWFGLAVLSVAATVVHRAWFHATNTANRRLARAALAALASAAMVLLFAAWGELAFAPAAVLASVTFATALGATSLCTGLGVEAAAATWLLFALGIASLPSQRALLAGTGYLATFAVLLFFLRVRPRPSSPTPSTPTAPAAATLLAQIEEPSPSAGKGPANQFGAPEQPTRPDRGPLPSSAQPWPAGERMTGSRAHALPPAVPMDRIPTLLHVTGEPRSPLVQIELGPVAGSGGMGTVYEATQRPLHRRVAVKVPADDETGDAKSALVREGMVAGLLDHPNIVPIHALGRGADDQPHLIMKYVEGRSWLEALADGDRLERLAHHLGILMKVCNAVDYAHHRGVVHRDLKVGNVMIGAFGEVQVLDWGLAVAIDDAHRGLLPLARDVREPEGTAAYMAPEMVAADAAAIGPRTDVYLLGGILQRILTGAPPHAGIPFGERLEGDASARRPIHDPGLPRELVAICTRALEPRPAMRFASAADLRDAIADFLAHEGSLELTKTAMARTRALETVLASDDAPVDQVHELVAEARVGFRAALASWPENASARAGLQRALELACGYEVAREDHDAAASLVTALPEPSVELQQKVAELAQRLAARSERLRDLEQFEHGVDLAVAKGQRMWGSIALGIIVVGAIVGLTVARVTGLHQPGYLDAIVIVTLAFITNAMVTPRDDETNAINVRLARVVAAALVGSVAHFLCSWQLGVDFTASMALAMLLFGASALVASATVSWLVLPSLLGFYSAAIGITLWPEHRSMLLIAGFTIAFGALAVSARSIQPRS